MSALRTHCTEVCVWEGLFSCSVCVTFTAYARVTDTQQTCTHIHARVRAHPLAHGGLQDCFTLDQFVDIDVLVDVDILIKRASPWISLLR